MEDYLVKALGFDGKVRAYAVRSTNTVGEAQKRHNTWPTATVSSRSRIDCWSYDGINDECR